VDRTQAAAFALRAVALFDRTVVVRVAAAQALGRFEQPAVGVMLRDALNDPSPLVRDAAARTIARCGAVAVADALGERALTDENWTVRRTCVFAYAALAGFSAVDTLLEVLQEPFWRVRHAAVLMLESLGRASEAVRTTVMRATLSTGAARRAQQFLDSRWSGHSPKLLIRGDHPSDENDPWYDDDPAVMTAKVLANTPPDERCVAMLGESHEPLRKLAIAALGRSRDRIALAGAACWLDVERLPHAAESARKVLRLASEPAQDVAVAAVESKLAGVAAWAIHVCAARGHTELADKILARAADRDVRVRRAVAFAVPMFADQCPHAVDTLLALLADPDQSVREAAVAAAVQLDDPAVFAALNAMPMHRQTAPCKLALVQWAAFHQQTQCLIGAKADSHSYVVGAALSALQASGALSEDDRQAALTSRDPWRRSAVICAHDAMAVLASEIDPTVRRIAIDRACAERASLDPALLQQLAAMGRADADPWICARAISLSDLQSAAVLCDVLQLSASKSLMVRAAAASALERASVSQRVVSLLREGLVAEHARTVALSWALRTEPNPVELLRELSTIPALAHAVSQIALTLAPEVQAQFLSPSRPQHVVVAERTVVHPPYPTEHHRALGRTGLHVSRVAISGVSEPPERALVEARERGVNCFFWEPRHRTLTRFIRKSPKKHALHVIAGSYHADEASIRADVDRALRLLRVERLGVFLLFWARSATRLNEETFSVLDALKREGKIASHGFSTHLRSLASNALAQRPWDVVMTRYNAAHVNAERDLLPAIGNVGAGAIAFTALCYGRLLRPASPAGSPARWTPSASDCYRFALSHPSVNLVLSAPSSLSEARDALTALIAGPLEADKLALIRAHGARVYAEDTEFNALVRKGDRIQLGSPRDVALSLLDATRPEV
jgi:HEAT repeat protein